MNARFLLDTNVLSAVAAPVPSRHILGHLGLHQGHVAVASTTWHELHYGVERLPGGPRKLALLKLLELWSGELPILEYDRAAAEWHARERVRLQSSGRTIQPADAQIAAVAVTRHLTLVTANVKDFRHYSGLNIVDWSR